MVPSRSLRGLASGAGAVAVATGAYGFLAMMGAFGPVSCWTSRSASSTGEVTTSRGCTAGVDYLLGGAGGNAPVLFFWAVVLLGLVALGGVAAWRGRRYLTWTTAAVGVAVSVVGVMSVGWYFVLPTLSLLVAAAALTLAERRAAEGRDLAGT
jgi:hypothetical protein